MEQPEDLNKKRRRSWYVSWCVTLVLSVLYTVLAEPVAKHIGFFALAVYPMVYLVVGFDNRLMLGGEKASVLFTELNFVFCLVVTRIVYWMFKDR